MRRQVIVRKRAEPGAVTVRCGDTVLGTIGQLAAEAGETFAGSFAHRPAFADYAERFRALDRALAAPDEPAVAHLRAAIERDGVEVWHGGHDMRIDRPATLEIARGRARFGASGGYLAMRSGGLG